MSKQDKQGARTPADLQYRYGTSFAETIGIAKDARTTAEEAKATAEAVNKEFDQDEIFNRLTNNGEAQGLFKDDAGQVYINADYIVSLEKMFAKDIIMTGKLTATAETYIPPGADEMELMQGHINGLIAIPSEMIPLYDFSGDGSITSLDLRIAQKYNLGLSDFSAWPSAKKSTVTLTINIANPAKFIHITGTNMWGRAVDLYYGCSATTAVNPETETRIADLEARVAALES
jgi:hypothetical protein